jgi:catalase
VRCREKERNERQEGLPKELVHNDQYYFEKEAKKEESRRREIIQKTFGKSCDKITQEEAHDFAESFIQKAYYFSKLNKRQVARLVDAVVKEVRTLSPIDKSVKPFKFLPGGGLSK